MNAKEGQPFLLPVIYAKERNLENILNRMNEKGKYVDRETDNRPEKLEYKNKSETNNNEQSCKIKSNMLQAQLEADSYFFSPGEMDKFKSIMDETSLLFSNPNHAPMHDDSFVAIDEVAQDRFNESKLQELHGTSKDFVRKKRTV